MSDSFGARLRRQREARGIDLVAIAGQTKINLSLLQGLEQDDVSHWPSGIFRRAFIRAYAHAIGADEEAIVREFLDRYPESDMAAVPLPVTSGDEAERANAGPHTRLRSFVGSAFGSLSRRRRAVPEATRVADPALPEELVRPVEPPPLARPAPLTDPAPPAAPEQARQRSRGELPAREPAGPDLTAVADLCTQFGRVDDASGVLRLLEKAASMLHATGLIVWVWDGSAAALKPALAHGYPGHLVARLPPVRSTANNATAAAFRAEEVRAIDGGDRTAGALAVPLLTPTGCAGVLAIELEHGNERTDWVRDLATIVAAMLAQLIAVPEAAAAQRQGA